MKLYGHPLSGNTHRAKALIELLGVDYEFELVDLKTGAHKAPEFLALNPLGQVPVLTEGELVLRDSTAIMTYIGEKYDTEGRWFPKDPTKRAQVQEWLSVAVNEVQNGPFMVRAIKLFGVPADADTAAARTTALYSTLFEPHLTGRDWLVGDTPTAADLACYAYVARVTEGGFDLSAYPAINAWIQRVEAIEGLSPMVRIEELMAAG
ncbi:MULTISPECIES: glutathione S-transferase family protein [unclassified Ruegeria]|uniref:glutathione S-transferase family protein n=1 Tax=unclassified Ruegeria TaxID=2625375 RepID=UPI0014885DB5|nr:MULTISPECIES: glutathione S-transferase family protein [unclassified Ruegeria]